LPVVVTPMRAVALAGELIEAALPKLDVAENIRDATPRRRRGGDPFAQQRRELYAGLRAIAEFRKKSSKPLATVVEEIIDRQKRYQPMARETDPERVEMLRVRNTGLRVPGPRRLANIISDEI